MSLIYLRNAFETLFELPYILSYNSTIFCQNFSQIFIKSNYTRVKLFYLVHIAS